MHVVLLSNVNPYPVMDGYSQRVWHQARHLARLGVHVSVVYPDYESAFAKERTVQRVRIIGVPAKYKVLSRLVFPKPDNVALLPAIIKLHRREKIDILQMERPFLYRTAKLAQKITRCRLVLTECVVEYDTLMETAAIAGLKGNAERMKKTEGSAIEISSRIITCSQKDALRLCSIYNIGKERFRVIPNGADVDEFRGIAPYKFKRPSVLFVGSGRHYPNRDAVWRIVHDLIPAVKSQHKDVLFVIAGSNLPEWLSESENLKVINNPKSMTRIVMGASVCIAPVFHGSGTSIKVVEYMAAGRPVIATKHIAEPLGLKNHKTALIADTTNEFADAILDIITHERKAERIGTAAKKLAKEKYNWDMLAKKLLKVYSEMVRD